MPADFSPLSTNETPVPGIEPLERTGLTKLSHPSKHCLMRDERMRGIQRFQQYQFGGTVFTGMGSLGERNSPAQHILTGYTEFSGYIFHVS
jgi:hypothetical protein